jgi:hypothetical protein
VEQGVIKEENKQMRLTTGTKLPQVNVKVWEVAMQHEKLTKSLEEIANEHANTD